MCSSIFGRQRSVIRPYALFAGIWTGWPSTRKPAEGEATSDLFAFLTTEPNAEVETVHTKVMPAILTEAKDVETWPGSLWHEVSRLQRPRQDRTIRTAARGAKFDRSLDGFVIVCATATQG